MHHQIHTVLAEQRAAEIGRRVRPFVFPTVREVRQSFRADSRKEQW